MQKTNPSKVAIIGPGNIGRAIATNLVKANRAVILAGRDITKTKKLADELGSLVSPMEIGAAIKEADIIIMAVWFDAIKELFYQYNAIL